MATKAKKCVQCKARKGQRFCAAKHAYVCSRCCGQYRGAAMGCPDSCEFLLRARKHQKPDETADEEFREKMNRFQSWDRIKLNKLGQATRRDLFLCEEYNILGDIIDRLLRQEKEKQMIIVPLEDEDIRSIVAPVIEATRRFLQQCGRCEVKCLEDLAGDASQVFSERATREGVSADEITQTLGGSTKADLFAFDLAMCVAAASTRELGRSYVVRRMELDEEWLGAASRLIFDQTVGRARGCFVCNGDCLRDQNSLAG